MEFPTIKHSIVLISYNQEEFITRALNSVVNQTILPDEIIVLDDCSIDQTVELANKFFSQKPIEISYSVFVNKKNIGIAANIKKISEVVTGNVISILAADDELPNGLVSNIKCAIESSRLDPNKDIFVCFSPLISLDTNGENPVLQNVNVYNNSAFETALRKNSSFAKVGFSKGALHEQDYPENLGLWADWAWDVGICAKANKYYVIRDICYTHYRGLGVSSKESESKLNESYMNAALYIMEKYNERMSVRDKLFILGEYYYSKYIVNRSKFDFFKSLIFALVNFFDFRGLVAKKNIAARYIPDFFIFLVRKIK